MRPFLTLLLILLLPLPTMATTFEPPSKPPAERPYFIGNSLTWDTLLGNLDGDKAWHVDCGKPLDFILNNPEEPCVGSSTLWPTALAENQYDYLVMQPHYDYPQGARDAILHWMAMQPEATIVIHQGWAPSAAFEAEYHSGEPTNASGKLIHNQAAFAGLLQDLQTADPLREYRLTRTTDALEIIYHDIEAGESIYADFTELYRDAIHMTAGTPHIEGRYLMHSLMRQALKQPPATAGFPTLDPEHKAYLDGVIARIPEWPVFRGGDLTFDEVVNIEDLEVWRRDYGTNFAGNDFLAWQRDLEAGTAYAAVPEPGEGFLMAIGALAGGAIRIFYINPRRRRRAELQRNH